MTDSQLIAVHAFACYVLMLFSIDETLLPRLSTSFREPPFSAEISPLLLKLMYSVLSVFKWRPMPPDDRSRLFSRDSAWVVVFARNPMSSA